MLSSFQGHFLKTLFKGRNNISRDLGNFITENLLSLISVTAEITLCDYYYSTCVYAVDR